MFDYKAIETFLTVAKLRSFRRAAERLNTTQPAISQRIRQLEADLGVRLLERDRQSVNPTPQGRALIEYGERMLKLRAEALAAVAGPAGISGVLRIGASETIVHTWLPRLIRKANERFPRLSLEIEVDISPRLLERLRTGALDLAFMVGPSFATGLRARRIADYPMGFIASTDIKWSRRVVPLTEIATWPIVTFSRGTKPFEAVEDLFASEDIAPPRLHASASLSTVVKMVIEGISIAAIPPVIVSDEIKRGVLRSVKFDGVLPSIQFDAVWRSESSEASVLELVSIAQQLGKLGA